MVISDLMMPDISGLQFLRQVKQLQLDLQVIIVSGYATRDSLLESFKLGAFDFLPKPFEIEELLGMVHRCMQYARVAQNEGVLARLEMTQNDRDKERLYCLGQHAWIYLEKEGAVSGLGKTFAVLAGQMRKIELPAENTLVNQGDIFVKIIDKCDRVHRVCAPISGRILEINENAGSTFRNDGTILGQWLVRFLPTNLEYELTMLEPC
jgi:CheY-like chemotaxis protein